MLVLFCLQLLVYTFIILQHICDRIFFHYPLIFFTFFSHSLFTKQLYSPLDETFLNRNNLQKKSRINHWPNHEIKKQRTNQSCKHLGSKSHLKYIPEDKHISSSLTWSFLFSFINQIYFRVKNFFFYIKLNTISVRGPVMVAATIWSEKKPITYPHSS